MTLPTLTVEIGHLTGWTLGITGKSELGTTTTLASMTFDNITSKVRSLSIRRGRNHELDRVEAGTASVRLLNQDGAFNPTNTTSTYYPNIRPMIPIRIRATLFDPTNIAGLTGWFDFSLASSLFTDTARTTPVASDGDIIKGVTDLSGSGNHLSEATNGPQYKVSIQNGRSVSRYDGTNDRLSKTGMSAPSAGWTWFGVIIKRGALTGSSQTVTDLESTGQAQLFTNTANSATNFNFFANQAAGVAADVATTPLSWGIKVMRCNSTSSLDVYSNGGTPVNFDPQNNIIANATVFSLGSSAAAGNFGDYDIGEYGFYNTALGQTNMNSLGSYLATRWNLTWTAI